MGREGSGRPEGMRRLLVAIIRFYQKAVSPYIGPCCRFHPSCSEYTVGSIEQNGAVVGLLCGLGRIARCHPFHPGGVDPPRRVTISFTRMPWKNG